MRALLLLILASLAVGHQTASFGQTPSAVHISIAALDTLCYPSCDHPSEWKATLAAEVRDSAGVVIPPSSDMLYEWGADFCGGNGLQWGFSAGPGRWMIDLDGNKIKNTDGCCPTCPYQSYLIAVRVTSGSVQVTSALVRVPDGGFEWDASKASASPNPFELTGSRMLTLSLPVQEPTVQVSMLSLSGDLVFRREYSAMEYYGRIVVQIPASDFADQVRSGVHFVVAKTATEQFMVKVAFLKR